MRKALAPIFALSVAFLLYAAAVGRSEPPGLERQVDAVERAFARSMAERDFDAFRSFLDEEAVFLGGGTARRGKSQIAGHWSRYFEGEEAPFSWEPATVEVLESGRLAISTGPVFDSEGARISTYTSIWRRDDAGDWRIVFDKGDKYCE